MDALSSSSRPSLLSSCAGAHFPGLPTRGLQVVLGLAYEEAEDSPPSGPGTLAIGGETPGQHRLGGLWPGESQSWVERPGDKCQSGCAGEVVQPLGRPTGTQEVEMASVHPALHSRGQAGPIPSGTLRAQVLPGPGFCDSRIPGAWRDRVSCSQVLKYLDPQLRVTTAQGFRPNTNLPSDAHLSVCSICALGLLLLLPGP